MTYNAFKESDLRNRIFSPKFGLIIRDIVNDSITNLAIILISTSLQLKVNIWEFLVYLKKVLVKCLFNSYCKKKKEEYYQHNFCPMAPLAFNIKITTNSTPNHFHYLKLSINSFSTLCLNLRPVTITSSKQPLQYIPINSAAKLAKQSQEFNI